MVGVPNLPLDTNDATCIDFGDVIQPYNKCRLGLPTLDATRYQNVKMIFFVQSSLRVQIYSAFGFPVLFRLRYHVDRRRLVRRHIHCSNVVFAFPARSTLYTMTRVKTSMSNARSSSSSRPLTRAANDQTTCPFASSPAPGLYACSAHTSSASHLVGSRCTFSPLKPSLWIPPGPQASPTQPWNFPSVSSCNALPIVHKIY
jgi:hypothetical protein